MALCKTFVGSELSTLHSIQYNSVSFIQVHSEFNILVVFIMCFVKFVLVIFISVLVNVFNFSVLWLQFLS